MNDYFAELQELFTDGIEADAQRIYGRYENVLHRFVNDRLEDHKMQFSGLFSMIDYLLKEHAPDNEKIACRVHDLRRRIRTRRSAAHTSLEHFCLYDLHTLCSFITLVNPEWQAPEKLVRLFPKDTCKAVAPRIVGDSMRIVVHSFDEHYIYGRVDEDGNPLVRVCYDLQNEACVGKERARYHAGDWTYLRRIMHEGSQLNIVRPRLVNDVYEPEIIILEPDYLVDISSIAACCESYAHSPLIHLVNKLKPSEVSVPLLMGNLAGRLLDEELLSADDKKPGSERYKDVLTEFFSQNALDMSVCEGLDSGFHDEACNQMENIHNAVSSQLPESSAFKRELAVVEPSFYCELLGLQGRMDLLQTDFSVLVEQKSGKSAFPVNPDNLKAHPKHLMQVLLYLAVLHYGHGMSNSAVSAFLLYSKYPLGLVKTGPAPQVLFEAFRLRNQMVEMELRYGREHGADFIFSLTPDYFRQERINDRLWQYVERDLRDFLSPLRRATDLERSYFLRFFRFLEREHLLSKLGNGLKECSGFASTWLASLEEKQQAGTILLGLNLTPEESENGTEVVRVRLESQSDGFENDLDATSFRRNDIVVFYPYKLGSEPDMRRTMVFRAYVESLTERGVVLLLRAPQRHTIVFQQDDTTRWAVEKDFMESSSTSLYRSLYAFLLCSPRRRALLLGQRNAELGHGVSLRGDYGDFNELVMRAKQADDYFLVIGPPGTGKTSYGLMSILKEQLAEPQSNVLLVAYTNRAVDEICSKLAEENIDFLRIGGELACAEPYREHLLRNSIRSCRNVQSVRQFVQQHRVFVGTSSSLGSHSSLFALKQFDLAIIDEASQILEPHILGILSAQHGGSEAVKKFVLIGDHKQLPAVVQQSRDEAAVDDPLLQSIGLFNCQQSLFERLLRRAVKDGRPDPSLVYMLTRQGRMHPAIAAFSNHHFYQDRLDVVPLPHQLEQGSLTRVRFIPADRPQHSPSDKVNMVEARIIASLVEEVYRQDKSTFDTQRTVGVIVPYRNQISAVRQLLPKEMSQITIDTVECYQGSQRDVIIYGFTVQRPYQLKFLTAQVFADADGTLVDRKLNVALTRARRQLFLVGNPQLLALDPIFSQLLNTIGLSSNKTTQTS